MFLSFTCVCFGYFFEAHPEESRFTSMASVKRTPRSCTHSDVSSMITQPDSHLERHLFSRLSLPLFGQSNYLFDTSSRSARWNAAMRSSRSACLRLFAFSYGYKLWLVIKILMALCLLRVEALHLMLAAGLAGVLLFWRTRIFFWFRFLKSKQKILCYS